MSSSNIPKFSRARTVNITCTTSAQEETVYTCPANTRTHVVLLFVKCVTNNVTVDVEWDRADSTHAHILGGKNMSAGEYIQFSDSYIVFEPGDALTITATGSSPHVDVFATVEEFFVPVGG